MALRRRILIFTTSEHSTVCTHDCSTSPSPPPLPSPLSTRESFSGHHLIANIVIATVSVSSAILFLILTYYTVLVNRRRRGDIPDAGDGFTSELGDGEADYPVWHVRTVGLDESAINSISPKPYVSGAGTAADCSVCLGDFCEGELVRILPACGHAFHVSCIDTWLRAHINCPLCRAKIIDPDVAAAFEEGDFGPVVRALEELEEEEGVDVIDTALDCIESSRLRDRGGLPEIVSGEQWRSDLLGSFLASELSSRMDRERSEDGGHLNGAKQRSSFSDERQQKKALDYGGGSTSGSGRIFFFSIYGRSRSSSVLPV
ncbi:RING-H2 finger protein ATL54-like [Phalaenopsis equestris]|uniref:RING-H2 finger protein ATL54-like n=1 Tax=Phalaenopsis equestris TaxID=78828 RepID=UPI0009E59134|nr:RING-H2 finger protein ATL54-like [Phalaenopsis equestris]